MDRKALRELQENERKFRAIFENTPAGLLITDDKGVCLDCNLRLAEMFGTVKDALVGVSVLDLVPDGPPRRNFLAAVSDGQPHRYEGPYRSVLTGRELHVVVTSQMPVPGWVFTLVQDRTDYKRAEEAFRYTEIESALAERTASLGTWRLDLRTDEVRWSEEMYRIFDVDEAEFGGTRQAFLRRVHPDDVGRVQELALRARESGQAFEVEYRILTRAAGVKDIRGVGIATRDEAGQVVGVYGVCQDISDRKRAEEELRRSEQKYRRLYESMTDAVASVDMTGTIVDFNPAFRELLGYTGDELRSLSYKDLTPEQWHALEARIIEEQVLPTGHAQVYEKEYRRWDGTVFPVELRTHLLRGEDGRPAGMWALIRDITERKRAEQELKASEEKYRRVFDNGLYPICIFDLETLRVVDANEAHLRLYGYTREEMLGGTIGPDLSAEPEASRRALADLEREGTVIVPLRYHKKKDGTVFPVELSIGRYSVEGRPLAVSMVRDITERRRAEEALQRANDELEATVQRRTVQLENAKRQLELDLEHREKASLEKEQLEAQLRQSQILEAVGRLAGGVAHDFNNLLASVLACAWVARQPGATAEAVSKELDRIQELCKQGGEVTRQLLAVARQTKGAETALDLKSNLQQLRLLVGRACPKTVSVVFDVADDLPRVSGDRGLLTTAVLNVCLNARDAMPNGGTLTVAARREEIAGEDWAVIEVSDSGEGIPKALAQRVFQPFFSTKSVGRGAGLGLPMALATAKSMGGSLELVSARGRGSTFVFRLPGKPPPTAAGAPSDAPERDARCLGLSGETILVVEDEDDIARLVERIVVRQGCRFTRARTGLEALEALRAGGEGVALILLDLVLPELSGAALHRTLAAVAPHIPVVFMTGRYDLAQQVDPTVPVLTKPFSEQELVERVRQAIHGVA